MQRFAFILILFLAIKANCQDWKTYPFQQTGSLISFPSDEGFHFNEDIEWIYFNGHLTGTSTGNDYSFVLAYFYYPAFDYDGFRIFNISNETTGQFYEETLPCIYESIAEDSLNIIANVGFTTVHSEEWVTLTDSGGRMIPFQYHISAISQTGSIDVNCNTLKCPLIVADSGFLYQGAGGYTYYYSHTMMEISGTISMLSVEDSISGTGWIDHQYGNFNPNTSENYEWFCIQLDNGMDFNIWNIFTENNTIPETSAYRICSIYINDSSSFTTSDFDIDRLGFEYTQDGERCYSQKWHIMTDTFDIDLLVSAQNPDNEVGVPFRFFEGSTVITGTVSGQQVEGKGFAELLHSYQEPDISIVYPDTTGLWDESESARWTLNNPDEGNTILYDLEICYDSTGIFKKIGCGISDTVYYWNPSYFTGDTVVILRITAYSADSTLSDTIEVTAAISSLPGYYQLCQGDNMSLLISLRGKGEFDYQWHKDGDPINGANDSIYILNNMETEDYGSYRCVLYYGCDSDTTGSYYLDVKPVDECTMDADKSFAGSFKVSPNPVTKSAVIEFNDNFNGRIEIMSCYGQIIRTEFVRNTRRAEIDLSFLIRGIYILRLNSKKYQLTQKIILVNK